MFLSWDAGNISSFIFKDTVLTALSKSLVSTFILSSSNFSLRISDLCQLLRGKHREAS